MFSRHVVVLTNLCVVVLSDTSSKMSTKSVLIIKVRGILSKVDRKVKRDGVLRLDASRVIAKRPRGERNLVAERKIER